MSDQVMYPCGDIIVVKYASALRYKLSFDAALQHGFFHCAAYFFLPAILCFSRRPFLETFAKQ